VNAPSLYPPLPLVSDDPLVTLRSEAFKGQAQAQYELGEAFSLGKFGVAKSDFAAAKWYRKAADQKHPQALNQLGICYAHGQGVAQDDVEAAKWFHKAAVLNFAAAQYNLGVRYYRGQGVAKDFVEAYKWILLASAQGVEGPTTALHELEGHLTAALVAEGKKRAREFKP